jgi:hypothetical protein
MPFVDRAALAALLAVSWLAVFAVDVWYWTTDGTPWAKLRAETGKAFDKSVDRVRRA